MKTNRVIAGFMFRRIKNVLKDMYGDHTKALVKRAKKINKELLSEVENISNRNPMANRIQVAFPIIALWLASDRNIKPENLGEIMYKAVDSFRVRLACKKYDVNKDKHLKKYSARIRKISRWGVKHPKESYSWRFSFDDNLHKEGCYHAVTFCPIADFCKKKGYEEIAPVLCKIDYLIVQLFHGVLLRKKTIASGDDHCDFWIVGDKKLMFIKW